MNTLTIKINGQAYEGWKNIRITRSIEQIASSFILETTDKYYKEGIQFPIKMGDDCVLEIDNVIVLTGYIDSININYSSNSHSFAISGRDKTGDLVDCCHTGESEYNNQSILELIKKLCEPFNLSVFVDATDAVVVAEANKIINSFVVEQGETIFNLITKLTKTRGLIPITLGDGDLYLVRAGNSLTKDSLQTGINILSGEINADDKERFSNYWIKSQGALNDLLTLPDATEIGGQAVDNVIQRFRPLILLEEDDLDNGLAEKKVLWEARRRAARSRRYRYKIQGWVQSNKIPWTPNQLISVIDSVLGISDYFLIVSVIYTIDGNEGTITELILSNKEGYDILDSTIQKIKNETVDSRGVGAYSPISITHFPRSLLTP